MKTYKEYIKEVSVKINYLKDPNNIDTGLSGEYINKEAVTRYFFPEHTGLDFFVFVKNGLGNMTDDGFEVKLTKGLDRDRYLDSAIFSIEDSPKLLASAFDLSDDSELKIIKWIVENKELLIGILDGHIFGDCLSLSERVQSV